ncbi:PDZK1-interacting protein 1 isoform X1 [Oryzias melastigma]|uniref:PDZK1-interacting protein 1 isoform X1 n=1 Tax=Oryzias melastigma TaxID=30732 RepID=UPI000CF7EC5C|nr:PDZK1-interacting protein 1 isoform X1 [Oryzias melastigma]
MGPLLVLVSSLLLVVGSVGAQTGLRANERLLPQWLTGIIAVSGFLLLAFIAFVVKKLWCEKSSSRRKNSRDSESAPEVTNHYDTTLRDLRGSKTAGHVQENYDTVLERNNSRRSSTDEDMYEICEPGADERRRDDHGEYVNVKRKATAM